MWAECDDAEANLPHGVERMPHFTPQGLHVLFERDPDRLSTMLMEYLHASNCTILAPITSSYFTNRPLYVVTIPKSGTHMLFELLGAMGYARSTTPAEKPTPGQWHTLMGTDTHTKCNYFMFTVNWHEEDGRSHPFFTSPVLFGYRNPLDVVVSECNYMLRYDKSKFAYYFNTLDKRDLYLSVLQNGVIPSIRQRILAYAPWLRFPNVIPVSYEELVGTPGGGSFSEQASVIWSIQLKLHVPGEPDVFGSRIYNKNSATFNKGRIGAFLEEFTSREYEALATEGTDFITALGYDLTSAQPLRSREYRVRPLIITPPPPLRTDGSQGGRETYRPFSLDPVVCNNYFVFQLEGLYYALPPGSPPLPVQGLRVENISGCCRADSLAELLRRIPDDFPPQLVATESSRNLYIFRKQYVAVPSSLDQNILLRSAPSEWAAVGIQRVESLSEFHMLQDDMGS